MRHGERGRGALKAATAAKMSKWVLGLGALSWENSLEASSNDWKMRDTGTHMFAARMYDERGRCGDHSETTGKTHTKNQS